MTGNLIHTGRFKNRPLPRFGTWYLQIGVTSARIEIYSKIFPSNQSKPTAGGRFDYSVEVTDCKWFQNIVVRSSWYTTHIDRVRDCDDSTDK